MDVKLDVSDVSLKMSPDVLQLILSVRERDVQVYTVYL